MKPYAAFCAGILILVALLSACGAGASVSPGAPPETEQSAENVKLVQGIVNRIDSYLVLLTDEEQYQVMDLGEGLSLEGFSEGDRVEVTYTGQLGEDAVPVAVAIQKIS